MTAITAVGCGCLATLVDGMIEFEYCPMHKAAETMLEALKKAEHELSFEEFLYSYDDRPRPSDALKVVKEAIAAAEGKS